MIFDIRKQVEILAYNYFRFRLSRIVITDMHAELFDFHWQKIVPFTIEALEMFCAISVYKIY